MNDPQWIKASQSAAQGECVEMAASGDSVLVRDSKDPGGPVLRYTKSEFAAWIDGAKDGEFDALL
jgi:hypothetical protein